MFYKERVIDVPDGLPKWSGLNDKSDLIEDSPREAVQARERAMLEEREQKRQKTDEGESKK